MAALSRTEPVLYTIRWRTLMGMRGSSLIPGRTAAEARQIFRRMHPHREVVAQVYPTWKRTTAELECIHGLT